MSLTLTLSLANPQVVANQANALVLTLVDSDADQAYTILSAQVSEATESDAIISQPNVFSSNMPPGVGNAILPLGGTLNLVSSFIINSPQAAGSSPQHAPGGAAPALPAQTPDANFILTAMVQAKGSSGTTFNVSASIEVPVLSAYVNDPPALGGALVLSQGANAVNFLTTLA